MARLEPHPFMKNLIRYTVRPVDPKANRFEVTCEIPEPDPAGQRLSLPAWIPGSYNIRDFARNVMAIRAEADGVPLRLAKVDKHTWQTAPLPGRRRRRLVVTMTVHAWELTVRGTHLDQTHGFFNGPQLFLLAEGRDASPCLVSILRPAGAEYRSWRIMTAMRPATRAAARKGVLGSYAADNYEELIDHPVEMGTFDLIEFVAGGVPHEMALTGAPRCDRERLRADVARVCEWHIRFFGAPPPFERYTFLVTALPSGHGGLEHRASTALITGRDNLPRAGLGKPDEDYARFLALCSHEYFHAWNVKRICPAALLDPDLGREAYTRLLWFFEGFTSYYDKLALVRCGLLEPQAYLDRLARNISELQATPGRLRQSAAESSFDAWIKYYRPDENAPNASVSYYAKGSQLALALDLMLRDASDGRRSLDDVMRLLWREHGVTGRGVPEHGVYEAVERIGGKRPANFLRKAVEGTEDPPLPGLLKRAAVSLTWYSDRKAPELGVRIANEGGLARLTHVLDGSPARRAGLAAGDLLVSLDRQRLTHTNFEKRLAGFTPGEQVELLAFRQEMLMRFEVLLDRPPRRTAKLEPAHGADARSRRLFKGWLNQK